MRNTTQRLQHLSETALAAKSFSEDGWAQDETQAIALASAMIDQAILARESREDGGREAHAVPLITSADQRLTRRIQEQQQWIDEHGETEAGYVERYGSALDPEHFGDGGEAIYAADVAALRTMVEERARLRHPSQSAAEFNIPETDDEILALGSWIVGQTPVEDGSEGS